MFKFRSFSPKSKAWFIQVGQSLLLPTAVLPIAGLLMMAGDLLSRINFTGASIFTNSGFILFEYLPILIAVCLSYSFSKELQGVAALSGAVAFLVLNQSAATLSVIINGSRTDSADFYMGIAGGFLAGFLATVIHNRVKPIDLPGWLGFFSGQRLKPILTALAAVPLGLVSGAIWTGLGNGLSALASRLTQAGAGGAFVYGFLNRLLLPLGLHHSLNQEIWYQFGDYTNQSGFLIQGDLNRFLAGDPTAGAYISGFFPMMIFAVPAIAACLFITARKRRRRQLAGLLAIVALVSLLSGVTEPIEYLLLFTSPILYLFYTLLYGVSLLICYQLQAFCGFSFSAGLSDYLANWSLATRPHMIWQVGLVMAALSFAVFYFAITLLKLRSPGRERSGEEELPTPESPKSPEQDLPASDLDERQE